MAAVTGRNGGGTLYCRGVALPAMAQAKGKSKAAGNKGLHKAVPKASRATGGAGPVLRAAPTARAQTAQAPPAAAAPVPRPTSAGAGPSNMAWVALVLAVIPAFLEFMYLVGAPEHVEGLSLLVVPLAALVAPVAAIVISALALGGQSDARLDDGARIGAIVALVLGIAVVATWGIPLLIAMIILASCTQPTPQPCTIQCSGSAPSGTCCPGCPQPGQGCCGGSGSPSGGSSCCGSGGGSCCGSDSGGGSCCGSGSGSGSGGGSCCGSSSGSSSGSGGGSCCGSGSSSGSSSGGGSSVGTPGPGVAVVAGGLAGALALRRARIDWPNAFSHHPDTPAYHRDVFHLAGLRLCVGCFTTFPVFLAAATVLAFVALPGPYWAWLVGGIALALVQGISAAGLARARAAKVLVKACLGAGLAVTVFAIRAAPWPPMVQGAALLALAGLAFASTIPRRRRMARAA